MTVGVTEIIEITNMVWESMLGESVEPTERPAARFDGPGMTSCVLISGGWEGGVTVDCPTVVARQVAATMFMMGPDEVSQEETIDALGELANMVGGNLKALLPGPSKLSLPSVTEGGDYRVCIPGTSPLAQVAFDYGGQPVLVSVHARS